MTEIHFENTWEFHEILDGDDPAYKVVDGNGDWVQDGRYQTKTTIVQHLPTGRFYQGTEVRSGSPFTDWEDSSDPILYEVQRFTETKVVVTWKLMG